MTKRRYWITPKNGNPAWLCLADDEDDARAYTAAWYGISPYSFYVSWAD